MNKAVDDFSNAKEIRRTWHRLLHDDHEVLAADAVWCSAATMYSNDWRTCACGNTLDETLADEDGVPYDLKLYELGSSFSKQLHEVKRYKSAVAVREARNTWIAIEERTAELLEIKS